VIAVRPAESDADLEAWRRVRIAAVPNERAQTVDELREGKTPTQLYLLAELDGRIVGAGVAAAPTSSARASCRGASSPRRADAESGRRCSASWPSTSSGSASIARSPTTPSRWPSLSGSGSARSIVTSSRSG
jgi:hypothetical protein